jgi:phosphopantothenoylcysteine decarboxylase/phosphopantothenate--cysteine ligase
MWENPAVRANVRLLRERGYRFVDPEEGDLACGEFGRGKMAEPAVIVDAALKMLGPARPDLPRVLVTAGRTEEPIDPVRSLSNHSSGKMGVALAEAARAAGHAVTFVHGGLSVPPPLGVERIEARTAQDMLKALKRLSPEHPILIMAAAVADYRVARPQGAKIPPGRPGSRSRSRPTPISSPRSRPAGRVSARSVSRSRPTAIARGLARR